MVASQVKKSTDWQAAESVKTLAQMRTHIEKCKEWLTAADDGDEELQIPPSRYTDLPWIASASLPRVPNIGIRLEDIPPVGVFTCFLCDKEDQIEAAQLVSANPFTRAPCMVICQNCTT